MWMWDHDLTSWAITTLPRMTTVAEQPARLVVVGAGPTAASLLERLSANVIGVLGPERPLEIHVVDPHRAGTGRVWRPDLDPLLWMNSMAEDVTMFTDDTVACDGPIVPGPALDEWAAQVSEAELASVCPPGVTAAVRSVDGATFPLRVVQSAYLDWFHRWVRTTLPPTVRVVTHPTEATDVVDRGDGSQEVTLADGTTLVADVVVLALGHLDAEPDEAEAALDARASGLGLTYVRAGHTAELDLSVLHPGEDVLVQGLGLAFTDLVVLLTEGRGGRFVAGEGDTLTYQPSGREPVLHVGSRRGVPYRSKPAYRLVAPLAPFPRFLDDAAIGALLTQPGPLDFTADVLPLLLKEAGWAYYHELFLGHPERTTSTWDDFAVCYAAAAWGAEIDALVAATVPDPADRLDLLALDRPLAGVCTASVDALQPLLVDHLVADVTRRTDRAHSADLGAFMAMLRSFVPLGRIAASGRVSARDRIEQVGGWWFGFFMYFASGSPPPRVRQFVALAEAGLLRFVGADAHFEIDEAARRFVATSPSHPDRVTGTALVDARIAPATVSHSASPLLRRLAERGAVVEEVVADGAWSANTGKVVVGGSDLRMARSDGTLHPRRHALGTFTNRPAAGTFARPRTNAAGFRQNDHVARSILRTLAG